MFPLCSHPDASRVRAGRRHVTLAPLEFRRQWETTNLVGIPARMPTLFDPIRLGDLDLPNRVIMAPLTRMRADRATRAPTPLMAEQYVQRASAGLILAEATSVDAMGVGYEGTPGIWTDAHVEGWRQV